MKELEKKMVDLVVEKCLNPDYRPDIWFCSNIFMVFSLPTHKLRDNPSHWVKKTPLCELTVTRHEKYEIPYGCYARLNQIFIDTEVKTKNTNIIEVGRSFNEYVKKLGYKEGKANRALLRQLINYVTSVIRVEPKNPTPNRIIGIQSVVGRAWDIYFDVKNPEQLTFSKGRIILSETYAKYIYEHSVPLNMHVVRCFKRNPLALDFYRFLVYRNNDLERTAAIPEGLLFKQLGTEQQADFVTRSRLKKILKMIQVFWPVRARFEDGFFELKPSLPAVLKSLPKP